MKIKVVSNYYRQVRGASAFAMEICGVDSPLFKFFSDEFEKMWEISKNWDLNKEAGVL